MRVTVFNGGRREGSSEGQDCVLRSISTVTGLPYQELQTHFHKVHGRVAGQPTHFFPDGFHQDFERFGFLFKHIPLSGRPKVRDLNVDRHKSYLTDFHYEDIDHVAAIVGGRLFDNSEAAGIEDSPVAGLWEVTRIHNDPGLQASGTLRPKIFINAIGPRIQRKSELAARVNTILAAGTPSPGPSTPSTQPAISDPLAQTFYDAVDQWIQGSNRSQESWRKMVSDTLGHSLKIWTARVGGTVFNTESPVAQKLRQQAIEEAVKSTDDLRQRLLRAENDLGHDRSHSTSLTAAGPLALSELLTLVRQKLSANSIVQNAVDRYQHLLTKAKSFRDPGYTGARKWVSDPNGRHGELNGVVDETGEGWLIGDRQIDGKTLAARRILYPRDDPQSPDEFSGSSAYVTYQYIDGRGNETWRQAE